MRDLTALEDGFKHAIAKLPDYKRSAAWEYVKALRDDLDKIRKDRDDLADSMMEMDKRFLSLNLPKQPTPNPSELGG